MINIMSARRAFFQICISTAKVRSTSGRAIPKAGGWTRSPAATSRMPGSSLR